MPVQATAFAPSHLELLGGPLYAQGTMTALTLWDGESPLCCFGINSPWPGVGFAWFAERDAVAMQAHRLAVARQFRRAWDGWLAAQHYARLECRAPESHALANRLAQWVGFTLVSRKPYYGRDGETVLEYVLYPKG